MPIYELSVAARDDLAAIWLYISEQASDDIADRFIDSLEETCRKIAQMPTMGRLQDHIREGLRKHLIRAIRYTMIVSAKITL